MSTRYNISPGNSWHVSTPEFELSTGAIQVGYREITANMVGVPDPIRLMAWAIGFDGRSGAAVRYEDVKSVLGAVGGDGLAAIRLTGIEGQRFGSMSERTDLLGEVACTWISSTTDRPDGRGAVLAAHDDALVQILTVMPYSQTAPLRSTYLLDDIATTMEQRSSDRFTRIEPDRASVMDRLPALDDLPLVLQEAMIVAETYNTER